MFLPTGVCVWGGVKVGDIITCIIASWHKYSQVMWDTLPLWDALPPTSAICWLSLETSLICSLDTLLSQQLLTFSGGHQTRTVGKRVVRILLECCSSIAGFAMCVCYILFPDVLYHLDLSNSIRSTIILIKFHNNPRSILKQYNHKSRFCSIQYSAQTTGVHTPSIGKYDAPIIEIYTTKLISANHSPGHE